MPKCKPPLFLLYYLCLFHNFLKSCSANKFKKYIDALVNSIEVGEVSLAWLGYELPKLGVAGSNPALRICAN